MPGKLLCECREEGKPSTAQAGISMFTQEQNQLQLSCHSQGQESLWPPRAGYCPSAFPHRLRQEINPGCEDLHTEMRELGVRGSGEAVGEGGESRSVWDKPGSS